MQPRQLTDSQRAWKDRLDRAGGPLLRAGLLLIGAAVGVVAIGAYESQRLSEWPILAIADGVFKYRFVVVPLVFTGGLLLGMGLLNHLNKRSEARQ